MNTAREQRGVLEARPSEHLTHWILWRFLETAFFTFTECHRMCKNRTNYYRTVAEGTYLLNSLFDFESPNSEKTTTCFQFYALTDSFSNKSYNGNQSDNRMYVSSWLKCIKKKCEQKNTNLLNTMCHIWLSFINGHVIENRATTKKHTHIYRFNESL